MWHQLGWDKKKGDLPLKWGAVSGTPSPVEQEKGCSRLRDGLQRADWRASSSLGRRGVTSPGAAAASLRGGFPELLGEPCRGGGGGGVFMLPLLAQ